MDIDVPRKKNGLPCVTKNHIEKITQLYLEKFNADLLKEPAPIPIEEFLQNYLKLEIDYVDITPDISVLGLTTFDSGYLKVYNLQSNKERVIYVEEGTVVIDSSLLKNNKEGRLKFTCGHECGHWIFHKEMFRLDKKQINKHANTVNCSYRGKENILTGKKLKTDEEWMEWQANYASSCLIMPAKTFMMAAHKVFKETNIKGGFITLGKDSSVDAFAKCYIPRKLGGIFKVSKQAASIRLKELKLIEYTKTLSIMFLIMKFKEVFLDDFCILDILQISNFV